MMRTVCLWLLLLAGPAAGAAEPMQLEAGKLSLTFEPDQAFVRSVYIGPHKILQGISAPVRDQYWGTVPPEVKLIGLDRDSESFLLTFDVRCRQDPIDFRWRGTLHGRADGTLTFTFDGEAQADFLRNRIGFCVLHGPEAAGRPCVVETVDGRQQKGEFPREIAPHQPFKNIRAVTHPVADQVLARVQMEGDTFEMEDQRNWTDASFKTYCTPLELPYPAPIAKGTRVTQQITISIEGLEHVRGERKRGGPVLLRLTGEPASKLPGLGLQVSSQVEGLTDMEVGRLRALQLDHLRVDLRPQDAGAAARLRQAAEQAKKLQVPLLVGVTLADPPSDELQKMSDVLEEIPAPAAWLLLAAKAGQEESLRRFLRQSRQTGHVGRGENTNFTELNRSRPDPAGIELVAYGLNPQIHAFDDTSIVETLEIQGETVRSARKFVGALPLYVSPITLKNQTVNEPPPAGELPPPVDPRQLTPFTAAWTLASIKYLAEAGADRVTYFETVGWLGVMEQANGSPLPERFASQPSQLFPVYHVLRAVAPQAGKGVFATNSSDPLSVVGLALRTGEQPTVYLANLTAHEQTVELEGLSGPADARTLDAEPAAVLLNRNGARLSLRMGPHQVLVVEPKAP